MKQKEIIVSRLQQLVMSYLPTVDAFSRPMAERECNEILKYIDQHLQDPEDEKPPADPQDPQDGQTPENAD